MSQQTIGSLAAPKGLIGGPFGSSLVGSDYVQHGIPVIRGTNLGFGNHVGGEFVFVNQEKVRRDLAKNTAKPGDLIFTQRGTLGQIALVPEGPYDMYVVSQSQMRLRVDALQADVRYLYYACSSKQFKRQIDENAIATGVPHINLGILSRLMVAIPPLSEQVAIAEVLGALDDKIAANSRLIAILDALGVGLLDQFIPTVPLNDMIIYHKRPVDPSVLGNELVDHFSLPAFDAGSLPEVASAESIKSQKFAVDQPSVLVSKLNPRFPRIWDVIPLLGTLSLASTEFLVLESLYSTSTLLRAILLQTSFSAELESKVAGTSGSHQRVRPGDLLTTHVIDPRQVPVQLRELVSSLGMRAHAARNESSCLVSLRDTLLPALMSGKLRVKDAEKQLEEVL